MNEDQGRKRAAQARAGGLRTVAASALVFVLGVALPMEAAATPADPARCVRIDDDAARLACFDSVHGRSRTTPSQGSTAPKPPVVVATPAPAAAGSGLLSRAWSLDSEARPFELRPYKALYVLPVSVTSNINRRPSSPAPGHDVGVDLPNRDVEAKFQISGKTLAWRAPFGDLWIGYTQSSRWQLYQGEISRPFRETNYEPELLLNVPLDFEVLGWRGRMAGLSLNHQSNGRALPLSRSWNRVIGHFGLERGDWALVARPWVRLREGAGKDDNPDIEDHVGRAELTIVHAADAGQHVSLRMRHSLRGGDRSRGSAELEWAFPLLGRLNGFAQLSSGYGESLIDYNIRQTRWGLGFSLAGWN